eukprot:Gb_01994 [translate_table: standard]
MPHFSKKLQVLCALILAVLWAPGLSECRLVTDDDTECEGRRVYIHDLPSEFNTGTLEQCEFGLAEWLNICPYAENDGFGQPYINTSQLVLGKGWFDTNSYMLELIIHSRMKRYRCLTVDSSRADAIFVPYYAGLDALRYLYNNAKNYEEAQQLPHGDMLMSWLRDTPEWERYGGKDHFMVMGRTAWDFVTNPAKSAKPAWGTGMLHMPGMANMTAMLIEKRSWVPSEQAIPYPTSFHPTRAQLQEWILRVRKARRNTLFSFAGSVRPYSSDRFRSILIGQCSKSDRCGFVDCRKFKCSHDSQPIISAFLQSVFCLQPKGDTATRRSTFDSIIAGCIPVFFDTDSAYTQYTWHLPEDTSAYSVYIPEENVVADRYLIQRVLESISRKRLTEMQKNLVRMIPSVIYMMANASESSAVRDAFDISVQSVLDRISEVKQQQSAEFVYFDD